METKKKVNYLIWYIENEDSKVNYTKKCFIEHTSIKACRFDLERLKKNPIVTRLKQTTYYE